MNGLKRFFLHCISSPFLSRVYGRIMRIKRPHRLARLMIRAFQRSHAVDMSRFQETPEDYSSLAEFFVRPLQENAVPPYAPGFLVSPADGRLVGMETVQKDSATQVKGLSLIHI